MFDRFAPNRSEPGLEVPWFTGRSIVVLRLDELSINHEASVGREIQIATVAITRPAFAIGTVGVGGKQDAAWLEAEPQLSEHSRQLLTRNMKQRRIRENAVETLGREVQAQEVLMQDLAA